jgi:hypothetical protein
VAVAVVVGELQVVKVVMVALKQGVRQLLLMDIQLHGHQDKQQEFMEQ